MLAQVLRLSQQEYEKSEILRKKEKEDLQRAMNERLKNISSLNFSTLVFNPELLNLKIHPGLLNRNLIKPRGLKSSGIKPGE